MVFHCLNLKTFINILTVCEISNDMTHGSGPIDLIPAAEDEAGLSIIHSKERQRANKNRHYDGQVQKLMSVCAQTKALKECWLKLPENPTAELWCFPDVIGSHEDVAAFIPHRKLVHYGWFCPVKQISVPWWHWLILHYNTAAVKSLRTIMGEKYILLGQEWSAHNYL